MKLIALIITFILVGSAGSVNAQPYDLSVVSENTNQEDLPYYLGQPGELPYFLNDSGEILHVDSAFDGSGAFLRIREANGIWKTIGNKVDISSSPISFSSDGAVAALLNLSNDVKTSINIFVTDKSGSSVVVRRNSNVIDSIILKSGGVLSFIESRKVSESEEKYYFINYANIFLNQNPSQEILLPIDNALGDRHEYKLYSLPSNEFIFETEVLGSDPDQKLSSFYHIKNNRITQISDTILPKNSYIASVTNSGIVILGFNKGFMQEGRPLTSDLVSPPKPLSPETPSEKFNDFRPLIASDTGEIAAVPWSNDFYNSPHMQLQIFSKRFGMQLPECFFPNSYRSIFTGVLSFNSRGQILVHSLSQDDKHKSNGIVLLTPNGKSENFINYCPTAKIQTPTKCSGRSGDRCKVSVALHEKSNIPLKKSTVIISRYGPLRPDADGGYYPPKGKVIAKGRTNSQGKINLKFTLPKGEGAYLYQVTGPLNHKTQRAQGKWFEIAR